ncbi:hypothetical protein ACOSQ2_023278 [Xanthoceras sorbifolium]
MNNESLMEFCPTEKHSCSKSLKQQNILTICQANKSISIYQTRNSNRIFKASQGQATSKPNKQAWVTRLINLPDINSFPSTPRSFQHHKL